jgi:hypothetical protein
MELVIAWRAMISAFLSTKKRRQCPTASYASRKTPTLACSVDLVGLLDQVHVACNNAGRDQSPNGIGRLIIGSNLMTLWLGSLSREFAN